MSIIGLQHRSGFQHRALGGVLLVILTHAIGCVVFISITCIYKDFRGDTIHAAWHYALML